MMDVTSQYTQAMTSFYPAPVEACDIVCGTEINLQYYQEIINKCQEDRAKAYENKTLQHLEYMKPLESIKGIFLCNFIAPDNEYDLCTFAPVANKGYKKTKLEYCNTTQVSRVLNTVQFKNLIMTGFKIYLRPCEFNIVFLRNDKVFLPFVKMIGDLKVEARNEGNKTKAKLLKLFLNSAAGKLAQRPIDIIDTFQSFEGVSAHHTREKTFNWINSYHYLATFVTAEANNLLFTAMYFLQLDYVYNKQGLSARCGSILYMDTDSVAYDSELVNESYYNFIESEEIGAYNEERCTYDATWKCKIEKADKIVVIAKKSYLIYDETEKPIVVKLKGVHTGEMKQISDYQTVKRILCGDPKLIKLWGLARGNADFDYEFKFSDKSNRTFSPSNVIFNIEIQKTVTKASNYYKLEPTNLDKLSRNADNLNKIQYQENLFHFLEFCCSELKNASF
jgi:DNA polymerase type B, organellar and viral